MKTSWRNFKPKLLRIAIFYQWLWIFHFNHVGLSCMHKISAFHRSVFTAHLFSKVEYIYIYDYIFKNCKQNNISTCSWFGVWCIVAEVLVMVLRGRLIMQGPFYWALVWHQTHINWKVLNIQHDTEEQVTRGAVSLKCGAEGFLEDGGLQWSSPLSSLPMAASRQPGRWGALLLSDPLFCAAVY